MKHNHGMIAAGDAQTAMAGAEMLQLGGNAIDAAVAAAFASFVAEMTLVNISGGGIATIHRAAEGETRVYDFFVDMPSGDYDATRDDFKEIVIDFGSAKQPFFIGRASVAVPGVVAGLCALAEAEGTLPLSTLLQPAIKLAKEGALVSESAAYVAHLLRDIFADTPASKAIYEPNGHSAKAGEMLKNPQLATTMERLGKLGADYFYRGELAQKIIADQRENGGLLTADDLQNYEVRQLDPLKISYRNYTILLPPPSSVGGVLIAFSLRLLSKMDLSAMPLDSLSHYQLMAEVFRLTNVARKDLAFSPNDVTDFLSDAHIDSYVNRLKAILAGETPSPKEPTFAQTSNDTTHISVVDRQGNIASITTSTGEGAGFLVADTGVALNNILGEIDLHPNGFHSAPKKGRLHTMMSPIVVTREGKAVLAVGSGGSTRLRSAIVQVLSNVLDFGLSLNAAVTRPRVHFEDGVFHLEANGDEKLHLALTGMGYRINPWQTKNMFFGGVHSVGRMKGEWTAVGDARRGGSVAQS